jgi:hypothetical protein
MGILRHRHSREWRSKTGVTAADEHPFKTTSTRDVVPNLTFPWLQLRLHTERYLLKKGTLTTPSRDKRLAALIQGHDDKVIAVAACGSFMSPQAVRDLLSRVLNIEHGVFHALSSYALAVVAANHVNPEAVTEFEANEARRLIPFYTPPDINRAGPLLNVLVTLLTEGVPTHSLLYEHINTLTRQPHTQFGVRLNQLRLDSQWLQAHREASWLSHNYSESSPENSEAERLLDSALPTWRTWASWRPKLNRLHRWHGFTEQQRLVLRDLLALEGPDFTGTAKSTLREGLLARGLRPYELILRQNALRVRTRTGLITEACEMLERLLDAVDAAVPDGTDLVAHLCVLRPVDQEALQILEGVRGMSDASIDAAVLRLYTAPENVGNVVQLSVTLNRSTGQALREALAPYLAERISNGIQELQNRLRVLLDAGVPWDGFEMELHSLGQGLQVASWLWPLLNAPLLMLLHHWPSRDEMSILTAIREAAQRLTIPGALNYLVQKIDAYCKSRLVLPSTGDLDTQHLIQALITLWRREPSPERREVALMSSQGPANDSRFLKDCLRTLPALPLPFVRCIKRMVRRNSGTQDGDDACVDLARLFASVPLPEEAGCWRLVFYRKIGIRGNELVDYTQRHLTASSWFQWLAELRFVFHEADSFSSEPCPAIMQSALHAWAKQLGADFISTIDRLERSLGSGPAMECFLTGGKRGLEVSPPDRVWPDKAETVEGFDSRKRGEKGKQVSAQYSDLGSPPAPNKKWEALIQILQLLENYYKEPGLEPTLYAIIERLDRDGGNADEIHEALRAAITMTPVGIAASARIQELYQRASPQIAGAVLAGWLEVSDIAVPDHRSLQLTAGILEWRPVFQDEEFIANLEAAAAYFDEQVASLLAEAERLDCLRVASKIHDANGISALLATLNIENPSPAEDALSSLPAALIDVVEKVSDQEVELHIPLTHLTPLQRTATGLGTAQGLLVRLIVGDSVPPGFCIHLDSDPLHISGVPSPWLVLDNSSVPDIPFCHGRPNRATYQLSRVLSKHLHDGFTSLEDVHNLVTNSLVDTQGCIICGSPHDIRLHRSTICQSPACSTIWNRASLDIQLSDIRTSPTVVNLLLTMLFATATTGRLDFLLNCPVTNSNTILDILDKLPRIRSILHTEDLDAILSSIHPQCPALLTWLCTSYDGFLVPATGTFRIPNMANQFLLANAAPHLERSFSAHFTPPTSATTTTPTRVLFVCTPYNPR